jgi:hypothetical protein
MKIIIAAAAATLSAANASASASAADFYHGLAEGNIDLFKGDGSQSVPSTGAPTSIKTHPRTRTCASE